MKLLPRPCQSKLEHIFIFGVITSIIYPINRLLAFKLYSNFFQEASCRSIFVGQIWWSPATFRTVIHLTLEDILGALQWVEVESAVCKFGYYQ